LDAARDAAAEEVDAAKEQRSRQLLRGGEANRRSDNGPPFANRARQAADGLSLEAHEVGTGDGTYNHWYIDAANYSRHFQRQKTLLIAVRDFSRSVPRVTVQVYFIGHPAERDVPLFVYGHVTVPVDLNGNLEVSGTVEAPVLDGHVTNIGNLRLVRGSDIDGWIVVGEVNSQRFQVRASRQRLFDLAEHSPERLAEMVARYDSHVRPR
jgi:hypothetical protein